MFRDDEKGRLIPIKQNFLGKDACIPGTYRGKRRDFCIADGLSTENLEAGLRDRALDYFRERNIFWHDGKGPGKNLPSNHLCCSQSFCINSWLPFVTEPTALGEALSKLGYPVQEMLPFEADKPMADGAPPAVAFEWIGEHNYLGEHAGKHIAECTGRSRGRLFTSADFAFRFRRKDGAIQIVLGEWKYTEYYSIGEDACLRFGDSGTDRLLIYAGEFKKPGCQIRFCDGVNPADLFYDPFDQLMRLQLLASAMERTREMGARIVSVLHVAPKANGELRRRVTPRF